MTDPKARPAADSRTSSAAVSAGEPPSSFACLWCGRSWTVRSPDDLEGFAQLCPDCLGKAGDNAFLRFRLRAALEARSAWRSAQAGGVADAADAADERSPALAAAGDATGAPSDVDANPNAAAAIDREMVAYYDARASEYDDWYLRRGRYAHGPIHDAAWNAELDAAGRWLDGLRFPSGRLVELAAGTGWWSPLLASKGELWMSDAAPAPLDRARERLLAHGLRAHLHVRDAWAEPEGDPAAGVFAGFWLSHVERRRTAAFLDLAGRWLAPGGRLALIDSLADPQSGATDHAPAASDRSVRRLADGRTFTVVKVYRTPADLRVALETAGFAEVDVRSTGRFFVLATGVRRRSDTR